ncbi:MAG: LCP family protein [Cyanobacteria bacterium J06641_5]
MNLSPIAVGTAKPRNWFARGLGLSCVAAVSATAGALLAFSLSVQPFDKSPDDEMPEGPPVVLNSPIPQLSRSVNVLVVGTKVLTSDIGVSPEAAGYHQLVNNSFEGLADTILLLRFDPETDAIVVLSIPRDTQVRLPRYGEIKINAANQLGGPALTAQAVQALLGNDIPIDRYARINVQGVGEFIDALDGIDFYVPKDMKYSDDSQHLYIDLKKGQQRLDGDKALQFLRFRQDSLGDIGRVQRQQLLMRAVVEQIFTLRALPGLPKAYKAVESNVDTNLSIEELLALAGLATKAKSDSGLQMLMLPGGFGDSGAWVPNSDAIARVRQQHFEIEGDLATVYVRPESLARTRIAIQDSTDRPEVAAAVAEQLRELGYRRVFVGRSWPEPLASTRILAQGGDSDAALILQNQVGRGVVRVESTGVLGSDVTLVIGRDWPQAPSFELDD